MKPVSMPLTPVSSRWPYGRTLFSILCELQVEAKGWGRKKKPSITLPSASLQQTSSTLALFVLRCSCQCAAMAMELSASRTLKQKTKQPFHLSISQALLGCCSTDWGIFLSSIYTYKRIKCETIRRHSPKGNSDFCIVRLFPICTFSYVLLYRVN